MQQLRHQTLSFGDFTLDLARGCLWRGVEEVKLRPKSFEALKYLVENSGRLVSKNELIEAVWAGTAVTDDSLVQCLIEVRRALGDGGQRLVKTVPRRGYIFDAEVIERDSAGREAVYTEEVESVSVIVEEELQEGLAELSSDGTAARAELLQGGIKRRRLAWAVFAVSVLALGSLGAYLLAGRNQPIDSVAVVPFVNVGGDPEMEYLADGLTESVINNLSQLTNLRVMSRNSIRRYRGKEVDPRAVGRELGVRAVLIGRLEPRGDHLVISLELVDALDNRQLWGERYDRQLSDLISLQSDISRVVSERLSLRLTGDEQKLLAKRHTENVEAYKEYMRGRFWWEKRYKEAFEKAIEHFNRAIALDPNYALAYAGLADCYLYFSPHGISPPREGYLKAKEAAAQALKLDPQLAEAHTSLAHLVWLYEWKWAEAESGFRRALELNPNLATAHQRYSVFLSSMGRHEEAIAEVRRAQALDPLSLTIAQDLMRAFYHARRYDEAIAAASDAFAINPQPFGPNSWLEMAYAQKGLYDEAIALRLKGMAAARVPPEHIAEREKTYRTQGWEGFWRKEVEHMRTRARESYVMPYNFARAYVRVGDRERALEWLERAYAERADHLVLLKVDPIFDPLRDDARFKDLLARVGLAP